jgi:hypothetical protein
MAYADSKWHIWCVFSIWANKITMGIGQGNKKGMPAASFAHEDGETPQSTSSGCIQCKTSRTFSVMMQCKYSNTGMLWLLCDGTSAEVNSHFWWKGQVCISAGRDSSVSSWQLMCACQPLAYGEFWKGFVWYSCGCYERLTLLSYSPSLPFFRTELCRHLFIGLYKVAWDSQVQVCDMWRTWCASLSEHPDCVI